MYEGDLKPETPNLPVTVAQIQTHNPAFEVSQTIDPKGRVVLERRGKDALLFRGVRYQPYVFAHEYDDRTDEWSHGNYLATISEAVEEFDPKVARRTKYSTRKHREPER